MVDNNKILFFICAIIIWIFFGIFSFVVRIFLNILYPIKLSINSLDNKCCHIYWISYTFLTLCEYITDITLYWMPFYQFIKFALFTSLVTNKKITNYIYMNIVKPLVLNPSIFVKNIIDNISSIILCDWSSIFKKIEYQILK